MIGWRGKASSGSRCRAGPRRDAGDEAMDKLIVGPVLSERGRYFFRTWTPAKGLDRSGLYDRLDDCRYAQRAAMKGADGFVLANDADEFETTMIRFEVQELHAAESRNP